MEHPDDDRPMGYGVCDACGEDCAEEDYDARTRISLHKSCEQKRARLVFYAACDAHGISDEELELYETKGMI